MHLTLLFFGLSCAWGLRLLAMRTEGTRQERWRRSLGLFLFPPLLLLMTAVALVCMGPQGQMVRWWEGWFSYFLAVGFLASAGVMLFKLMMEGRRSLHQVRTYPQIVLKGQPSRLLATPIPFIAQVGFWQSELVLSQGLIDTFSADHLDAVLTHEQAHAYYRDTFWFFWLGWLRRLSAWLPQTEALWQELLLLRERRADRWAAQTVDTLLLAEALVQMVKAPELYAETICAAFSSATPRNRLEERIDALLSSQESLQPSNPWVWAWMLLVCLPLMTVPFHY
ncbi:M56 family metallopeptidase [Stenomitos frigidus]|uniref:Zn-dependent protease with chaperone function n=1 Tax=Stenomitos frigidus ULC18 TaxID=2107698 RepID=A0A2T1E654_9CYAN|nr:M56 family metallopeptidase [Stenomitos frigidus]PSB28175.1 Zn-dependent protease with chaperone function [Stenomitos frigidus ULC18]